MSLSKTLFWQWKHVRETERPHAVFTNEAPGWRTLGPQGQERITHRWLSGDTTPCFLTLSPCVAYKFQLVQMLQNGMILKYASKDYHGEHFLAVRPRELQVFANRTVIQVEIYHDRDYVEATLLSGQSMLKEPKDNIHSWWDIVAAIQKKHGEMNMRLVFACCEVPRHLWDYDVLVPVPHVIDETQILMPRYLKVMKAPPKMKDASEKKAPPVMKASPDPKKVAKAMVALKKVMKAPAAMKAGGKGMKTKAMRTKATKTKAMKTKAMKTKAMKTKANKAAVKAKTMKKIYKKPSRK